MARKKFVWAGICLLAVAASLGGQAASARGAIIPSLTDVKANGTISATAAHGPFTGNDTTLLGLLNSGGAVTLQDLGPISISSTGMFSTAGLPDTRVGSPLGDLPWSSLGKSDDASNGPFTGNPGVNTGTLTLDSPLTGSIALSLKASNGYAVYAFQNVTNVSSFDFDLQAIGNGRHNLSHASLYFAPSTRIPEPTTFAIWLVLGGIGFVAARRLRENRS